MTEGWIDCPSLGPGWKRRQVLRKNGTRTGQSDTYYMSPRGEKIRSRVELNKLLGCSRDLTDFHFKKGIFVDPSTEPPVTPPPPQPIARQRFQKVKKKSKRCLPSLPVATPPAKKPPDLEVFEEPPDQEPLDQKPLTSELELPVEAPTEILIEKQELPVSVPEPAPQPQEPQHDTLLLAPEKIEDGAVQEANLEESIAYCASCQGQFPEVMLPTQRRCRWLCPDCRAQRRDFNREQRYYKKRISPKKVSYISKKLTTKLKSSMELDKGDIPIVKHRKKPLGVVKEIKKVGRPRKHPVDILKNSVEASSTSELTHPPKSCSLEKAQQKQQDQHQQEEQVLPLRLKNDPEAGGFTVTQAPTKGHPVLPQCIKEEPVVPCQPSPPAQLVVKESEMRLPAVNLLIATSPKIKQEHVEPGGDRQPSNDSPVSAGLPQFKRPQGTQVTEVVVLDDDEDDEVEQLQQMRPPVIMEIYSLGGMQPLAQLDNVLREFLSELNEIPLPAHWEALPPLGPNLRLVQRSKHSTMSAAVIYIRPGLYFQVVVGNLPVPPEHELYASHPARLTTVDEVVELICDLEAYRLCSGWPAGWHAGERSEACDVLVYSGCCPQCRLNPWPSGSGAC